MVVKNNKKLKNKAKNRKKQNPKIRKTGKEILSVREKDIAIIGIACRFPDAKNYFELGDNLIRGINSIKEIPPSRWDINKYYSPNFDEPNKSISKWCGLIDDIDQFDSQFFNISPREANNMDPQQRLLLEETWHCIEDAGVPLRQLQQKITSVYVGVMATDYHQEASAPDIVTDSYACLGNYDCILANRISYVYGLQGASISIAAACASSLVAIHEAKRSLVMKESDYSLAGGISLNFHPWKYISFSKSRMLSPDGQCKTFDSNANGYVPGDGVGIVLLQRLEDALIEGNHIYGIIKGSAVNHTGKALSITAPRIEAQKNVILSAYKNAGISPESINYIEAHGTGTSLGDPIEIESLTQAFREYTKEEQYCKIGSVKSNIGHLEAAAGIVGVIKVLMMMQQKKIPKSLNIKQLNPIINFRNSPFKVATELSDWQPRDPELPLRAGVSSFGFGGVNSHVVLEEYKEKSVTQDNGSELNHLFILSAKSQDSMKHLIEDWKQFVQSEPYNSFSLKDICVTLKMGRGSFPYRYGVHVHNKKELKELIEKAVPTFSKQTKKNWCFRIGDFSFNSLEQFQGYLERFNLFKQNIEDVKKCLLEINGSKKLLKDFPDKWSEPNRALYSFMVVYAGTLTLMDLGFNPDVITGEKAGVMVGLVISGIIKLEDALAVLSKQKNLNEIQFTRPKIPYYDSVLKRTVMPFHFTPKYLRLLVDELGRQNKRLGQLLVDGILYTEGDDSRPAKNHQKQTLLGNILLQNFAVTKKQLDEALEEQKKTKDLLGNILVKKEYCSPDAISECLAQQTILRYYVHEVFRHYIDKARLLNISQFTFKKYLEEWDAILMKSGKSILQLLYNEKLILQEGRRIRNEKLLLMLIIMNCLHRLNQKWNLTEKKLVEEKRFYELLDLVTDTVMPKEDLIELFLSDNPDYVRIAQTLNKRQAHRNLNNSYRYIKNLNPNIHDIEEISQWLADAMEIKNVLPADSMAFLPLDTIAFYEVGYFKAPLPVENSVHLKTTENISELFTESLLELWLNGVDIHWEKLYSEGSYKKVVLPVYPFDKKPFWLPRMNHSQSDSEDTKIQNRASELKENQNTLYHRRYFSTKDPIIHNHVITGKSIIPAASMIELGLAAIKKISHQKITLGNIYIQNPCIVEKEVVVKAKISLQEKQFIIKTDNNVLCMGKYEASTDTNAIPSIDLSNYTGHKPQDIENLYPSLSQSGYQYGIGLQVIKNIWKKDRSFVIELKKHPTEEEISTSLNPWILDGIFQSALAVEFIEERLPENNTLYVPYFIKSFAIIKNFNDHCFVCIDMQDLEKKGNDLNAQLKVFDAEGKGVLWIKDMLFKSVSNQFLSPRSLSSTMAVVKDTETHQIYYYKPSWVKQAIYTLENSSSQRSAILFMNESDLSTKLSQDLASQYQRIFFINAGTAFTRKNNYHFDINTNKEQDYVDVLQNIEELNDYAGMYDIYHLLAYEPQDLSILTPQNLRKKQEKGVRSLFFLAKALTRIHPKYTSKIIVSTYDIHVIEPQDKGKGFGFGGLLGLSKTIMMENPKIRIKLIDFAPDNLLLSEKENILLDESLSSDPSEIVAYRQNGRYILSLEPFHISESLQSPIFKDKGVYILTGGTGGIGIKIAKWITRQVNARLVLIDIADLSLEKRHQIEQFEKSGSEVLYLKGDLTNLEQMKEIVKTIKARFGNINGVIHTGGILEDKLLVSKDWDSFQRVMAPKIQGTWIINDLTKKEPLDFFVVFSSIVSIVGNIGQVDYAAANSFLDSFIHYRAQNKYPGKSSGINWTLWDDGGMGLNNQTRMNFETRGLSPISSHIGLKALEQIIQYENSSQLAVLGKRNMEFEQVNKAKDSNEAQIKRKTVDTEVKEINKKTGITQIESYLANIIASKIDSIPEEINKEESFFALGVESIILQEIMSELDKKYDHLTPTLLFEYPNIRQLADYLKDKSTKDVDNEVPQSDLVINEDVPDSEEIYTEEDLLSVSEEKESQLFSTDFIGHDNSRNVSSSMSPASMNQIHIPQISSSHPKGYEIAVIGMSGRFPKAPNIDVYWQNLIDGKDCIEEIPPNRWEHNQFFDTDPNKPNKTYGKWGGFIEDIDKFDPLFFNISPREAEQIDPQQRLFLEYTWKTMEHAGYGSRNQYRDKIVGLFVGTMWNEYSIIANQDGFIKDKYFGPGSIYWAIANRVSYFMDFKGPSIALDTACSSSLVAVHLACQSISKGDCDMAIAGGINLSIHPSKYIYLGQAKFLSQDGRCRSFGINGTGYVPGEGVGAVLLKPLERAIQDGDCIYGIIRSSATNHGGKATGFTVPNPDAHARLIVKAFERANISPEQIGYIECHGTGTSLGDPIEITGLTKAFRDYTNKNQFCPIGSVKSNIGHLEAAAGVAALIKVLLCMKHNKIPKSLHSDIKNPNINFNETPFYVVNETTDWASNPSMPKLAGISSFGAGGANAHLILESFEGKKVNTNSIQAGLQNQSPHIIVLSARNEERLMEYAGEIVSYLENTDPSSLTLSEIAYTLQIGREAMVERIALVVSSIKELHEILNQYCEGKTDIINFYTGNKRNNKDKAESLVAEKEGREILKIFIKSGKFDKIAQLWVSGVDIDWNLFYPTRTPNRISLPTYPFAREHYWIPDSDKSINIPIYGQDHVAKLHPFIDQNISSLSEEKFSTLLTGDEFYLEDHIVDNRKILPGVAYIEMARAAGEIAGERKVQKLKDIFWTKPITLADSPQKVFISLYPNHKGVDYKVITNGIDNQRIIHAQGKIIYEGKNGNQAEPFDIEKAKKRCRNIKENTECYRLFQAKGFTYGPRFQAIQKLWTNGTEALSLLILPVNLREGFEDFVLHPSLMDGALQTVLGLIDSNEEESERTFIPFSMSEVELIRPLPEKCYAHVSSQGNMNDPIEKRFNIQLIDEKGLTLVKMQDVTLRAFQPQLKSANSTIKQKTSTIIYYKNVWEESPLESKSLAHKPLGNILLFDSNEDMHHAIKEKLKKEQYSHIILVKSAKDYQELENLVFTINPGRREDYQKLMETLKKQDLLPNKIIYIWSHEKFIPDKKALNLQIEKGIYSILYLSQALMQQRIKSKVHLIFAYPAHKDEPQPQYAAISGFARTIYRENPKFAYKTLQIETTTQTPDILLNEIRNEADSEIEVRYEGGQRFVKHLQEFDLTNELQSEITGLLKERGVYVITGGMGGLGLIFAEFLAKQMSANLILTGRSDLSAEKETHIKRLESLGSEVTYIKADVSNREDVVQLISKIKSQFQQINGIIHSAGIIRDTFVIKKTKEEMDEVFAPKVYGTINLDEATKDEKLDFFVMFSSITAVMGNAGQCDYAYGNSFMDNFAKRREGLRRQGKRSGKTLSINWPLWKEGGMKVDEQTEKLLAKTTGMHALETQSGLNAFVKVLGFAENQLVVVAGDRQKLRETLLDRKDHFQQGSVVTEGKILQKNGEELLPKIQKDILKTVSDILKVSVKDIHLDEDMSDYGFDSVSFTVFANRINEKYSLDITPAVFFEHPSIGSFTQYLYEEHKEDFIKYYQDSIKPDISKVNEDSSEAEVDEDTKNILPRRFYQLDEKIEQKAEQIKVSSEPIAIIGISGLMPQSEDLEAFWKNLEQGKDLISEIPKERWDWRSYYGDPTKDANKTTVKWGGFMKEVDKFDTLFFGISPREAELMDPQQRIFLETVWKTIEDAGYKPSDLSGTKTGVFVGAATTDYHELIQDHSIDIEAQTSTGRFHSITANRISYFLNLQGPSEPVDTACSSSLIAIHRAIQAIRTGNCDMAIAGGVNVMLTPTLHISFSKAGMLSEDGRCKTFDKRANGYVRGEGVGSVLLKPLSKAEAEGDHIYAVIRATAENHGGHANSLTAPNPNAQADLLISAYEEAGIDPSTVSYIEAHGTGTSLGDPIEINGLKKAFEELYKRSGKPLPKEAHCGIGTVKTNIGHLETAAGIAGVLKVLLSMKYKKIPANIHFKELNPYIQLQGSPFYIVRQTKQWECLHDEDNLPIPRRAGISSFGFGGANAHIVLEEYKKTIPQPSLQTQGPQIILLSAKNEERLKEYSREIREFLEKEKTKGDDNQTNINLVNIAYTLQIGRESMEERLAVIVSDIEELREKLAHYCQGEMDIENLFRGNVKTNKINTGLLIEGRAGKEFIRIIINDRELTKLAQLWVSGVEIDWKLLYPNYTPRRISLPTYPFARERYWIPEISKAQYGVAKGLHPLIDKVIPKLSLTQRLVFQKTLQNTDLIVRDHKVQGQCILPGVGYLEMACEAVSEIKNEQSFKLGQVVWIRPLPVKEEKEEVHIVIKEENELLDYEIQSSNNGQTITHAKGIIHFNGQASEKIDQYLSIEEIKTRCTRQLDKEKIYTRFKEQGLNYGFYFQGLNKIWANDEEALGQIILPSEYEKELNNYILHPTLMDGALQTIAGIKEASRQTLLPFAVEEVEILHPLKSEGYAYVKALGNHQFHVAILDDLGLVCVKLHDVSLRELEDPLQHFFYCPRWIQSPLYSTHADNIERIKEKETDKRTILIIYPSNSLSLEKALRKAHSKDEVIEIKLGTETQQHSNSYWEINTADSFALGSCIQQFKKIHTIYFLGGILDKKLDIDDPDVLEDTQERGVISLFRLIKSLSQHNLIQNPIKLKVITNDAHQIDSDQITNPYAGSLFGLTKVIAGEYSMIEVSCIDMSLKDIETNLTEEKIQALVRPILTEPGSKKGEDIAIRDGKRYIRTLVPIVLPSVSRTTFRYQGVYLILGGAGGIGLELSRYLAETVQARLILLGRSKLDERRKEKISQIESKGGKVLYIKADATDPGSMKSAIEKAKAQFGKINGVIHSAIVLKDRILENMDEESFRAALDPKVKGSMALYKAVQGEPLDFFMFFSSAVSFFGNMGQSNYTAGCAFKDAFALYLNQKTAYPVKVINWGFWGSVGIAASEEYTRKLTALGALSIEPVEGMEAVQRVLGHHVKQIMALKAEEHLLESMGVDLQHQILIDENNGKLNLMERKQIQGKRESVQQPKASVETKKASDPSSIIEAQYTPSAVNQSSNPQEQKSQQRSGTKEGVRHYIESSIVENISASIGMSAKNINFGKPFSEYGVDSIIGLELINKLNKVFGIVLKTGTIFNYANVNDLSQYIYDEYGEKIAETFQQIKNISEERLTKGHTISVNEIFHQVQREKGPAAETKIEITVEGGKKENGIRSQNYKEIDKKDDRGKQEYQPKPIKFEDNHFKFQNIFLTGATGILGGYTLKKLLETTDSKIYCLVRANDKALAKERLKKILESYNTDNAALNALDYRVLPIIGDITKEKLDISEKDYQHLTNSIDCTIHIAASTNLVMPYDYLAPINVQGVKNIIDLVLQTKQKYMIHVSSYHVMADVIYRRNFAFTEKHFDVGQNFTKMGYQETKFEGERLVRKASQEGLIWNIVRPGNIFGEEETGFYPLDMSGSASIFHRLFEMIIKSGIAAFGNNYFDITPVDYIAKSILFLGLKRNSFFETYHLLNTDKKRWYEIINLLNDYGYRIKLIPVDDYLKMVQENNLPLDEEVGAEWLNLMKYGFANKEFFVNGGHADASYTNSILKEEDIICPNIDLKLLGTYLTYYASKGIIPLLPEHNDQKKKPLQQVRVDKQLDSKKIFLNKGIVPKFKEKAMKSKEYEFIIVGSGAGGATVARELAKRGKKVLIVEKGKRYKKIGGLMDSFKYFDHHKITMWPKASKEGVFLYRAIMAGGSTAVSCGNGIRCSEDELAAFGVNLNGEFIEAEEEMGIAPFNLRWLSKGSKKILEASNELGYQMKPMPKFMNYKNCRRCGTCYMGCQYNAKWTSLVYVDEAIQNGADIIYETTIDSVMHQNGKAIGVKGKGPEGHIEIFGAIVILAAGGLATPVILQKTGIEDAGSNLFGDLLVNTYGVTKDLSQLNEPSMALVDDEFHKSKGFILSTWPQPSRIYRFAEAGIKGMLLPPNRTLGIMTKSADDPIGRVYSDGSFSKSVTENDRARLKEGAEISKEILIKAGADSKSIVVGKPFGAHPGGTAAIGKIVNKDLQTEIDNLFVCDASVFPTSLGAPPILTIAALAKRLAKNIVAKNNSDTDKSHIKLPFRNRKKQQKSSKVKIA